MSLPFVSRYRLELANLTIEQQKKDISRLEDMLVELKKANAQLQTLLEEEKEARREAEQKVVPEPEESASRRRVFGSDVMRMATKAAAERAAQNGLKR